MNIKYLWSILVKCTSWPWINICIICFGTMYVCGIWYRILLSFSFFQYKNSKYQNWKSVKVAGSKKYCLKLICYQKSAPIILKTPPLIYMIKFSISIYGNWGPKCEILSCCGSRSAWNGIVIQTGLKILLIWTVNEDY